MLRVGIIGLPGTGKTTLFNALTRSSVNLERFSDEPHLSVIEVPDERFAHAVAMCRPKKVTPATIEFTEGGARIERHERQGGAHKFGTDFFSSVRTMDALLLVVGSFERQEGLSAQAQVDSVLEELLLADLGVIEGRLERLEKCRAQKREAPAEAAERQTLGRIKEHLEALQPVRTAQLSPEEWRSVRSYAFVSGKPLLIAVNVFEGEPPNAHDEMLEHYRREAMSAATLCAKIEMEIAQMAPAEERDYLEALGLEEAARDRLIRDAYATLGLISFFTVGEDEVRAWTTTRGTTAVRGAEKIHSDIARGFIRAEVIAFEDFRASGGCWDEARSSGKMRLEGKEYVLQDGDIMHVRFKV